MWDSVQEGIETAEKYGISQSELHLDQCVEAFSQGIKDNISQGLWDSVRQGIEAAEKYGIPQSELHLDQCAELFSQKIKEHISQGSWDSVRQGIQTAEECGIPQSELHLTEVFSQGIKEHISNSRWDDVRQGIALLKKYSPSGYTAEEFLREPSIRQSLLEIENLIPRLSSKMTIELFLDFITLSEEEKQSFVQTLLDNPFLAEAMVENKYGAKLIFKYPELDDLSKENITLLYEVKKERGELDPHSTEFRRAVQDRLLTYRNNQSIKTALEEDRVDVKTWLEYDERTFFDLGRDQETSSVEKLRIVFEKSRSQSFDRSVRDYLGRIVSIIHTQFKKDFQGKTLSEEVSPFEEELRTKQDVYEETKRLLDEETSKNEELQNQETLKNLYRRKIGIEKQILSLEEKIKHPKAVPAYDRVRGDVVLVDKALEKFSTSLKKMFTLDERLRNLQSETKEEQRKQIKELKKEQLEQERISQQAFELFYSRMKVLEERLGETFGNILGEEQKELFFSLLRNQEEDQFSEERDHMSSDMRTIQSLLEDQFRKKDSLEGTPMSVGLWDRNPDEDLYLGNYTDCCIRIDSEHMGEESTITDYLTDVGIQVLVVRDEKRDIPAVAAWLWIGKDEKTQEVVLVVDNIEANTEYSLSYEEQLKEQLRAYLEEYARNIGIENIVQGKYNNDITLFGKGGSYKKLGGYNREDGYFLEAEK